MTAGKHQNHTIKNWLRCYLKESDLQKVSQAVTKAETQTMGEIIPMVVRRSTNVVYVPLVLSLIIFVTFLILMIDFLAFEFSEKKIFIIPTAAMISFVLALFFSRWVWVQRLLTSSHEQKHDVHARAELEFYRGHYDKTEKHTGILLFISLMEKRAVVLADQGIASKLPVDTWDDVVKLMTTDLKKRDLASGLSKAIEKCGIILAEHFPHDNKNANEISNHLVVKD